MNQTGVRTIAVEAPAKLNLTFDILGTRPDGYHEISTIFQAISLSDRLEFSVAPQASFEIQLKTKSSENLDQFPLDESNLIVKAARLFFKEKSIETNFALRVEVQKDIPIGAGLAGGSSNAAATLLALNELFLPSLENEQLMELASSLGSDIPFCLLGGAALGGGRGELLSSLVVPAMHLVIVKPKGFSISTPWAYRTFDSESDRPTRFAPKSRSEVAAELEPKTLKALSQHFGNDFERLIFKHHPFLAQAKKTLLELGCSVAYLTGSGPTIYGLVENESSAKKISKQFLETSFSDKNGPIQFESWVVHTIDHGVRVINSHGNKNQS
jgi:4-diphosphocytidyl-2-C-methyl-D-erythritol kinase